MSRGVVRCSGGREVDKGVSKESVVAVGVVVAVWVDEGVVRWVDEGVNIKVVVAVWVDDVVRWVDEGVRRVDEGVRRVDEGVRWVDEGVRWVDEDYSTVLPSPAAMVVSSLSSTSCPALTSAPAPAPCVTSLASSSSLTCSSVSSAGCGYGAECGYYYHPQLYTPRPHHLITYTSLYGGSVGGGSHRHEVLGVTQGSHGRRKRTWTRAVFSNLQRKGLEKRFQLQKYITKPDRRQLAATLGLTDAQVKVWFQNRRMKWRHSELKRREQHQQTASQQLPDEEQEEIDPGKETEGDEEQEPGPSSD
ncbi:hypothetical protein Pmani_015118 [Petrolisthes manimaculis]|uniref:Homeobox domain-containing protein n=1 Tax=Petrolisthes manimaculis TaxID=1843537 RepID=A0AAE1PS93_9EUCA|nr:hypothetical protein Pmani_015118 [Petrolisthes manimaculis]